MFGKKKSGRRDIHTLVGSGTNIKGDLRFEGGCHIDGVVHGNVIADKGSDAFLTISEGGLVEGSVRVPVLSLSGKVQGDVRVSQTVTLAPTSKVIGNVHYKLLEMVAGAEVNGKLVHESAHVQPAAQPAAQPTAQPTAQPAKPSAQDAAPATEQRRPIAGGPEPVKQV